MPTEAEISAAERALANAVGTPESQGWRRAAIAALYAAEAASVAERLDAAKAAIIQDVCDLPDRTSPDDQPDMMLVSGDELQMILDRHLEIVRS